MPTAVFERLPETKRRSVLTAAAAEFARAGFSSAKVDAIAARAGISVGSLYQYFGTKEACFLAVLDDGVAELQSRLDDVLKHTADPWERIEAIVRLIPGHSRQHAEILRLYHEIGGEGLSDLGRDFCRSFEGLSAVRPDLDEDYAAFCLDSVFVALQFSYSTDYHKLRNAVYLGAKDGDDETLVARVLQFLKFGLAGRSPA